MLSVYCYLLYEVIVFQNVMTSQPLFLIDRNAGISNFQSSLSLLPSPRLLTILRIERCEVSSVRLFSCTEKACWWDCEQKILAQTSPENKHVRQMRGLEYP